MSEKRKKIYNLYEAKTHLSRLVDRVAEGDVVYIAKAGKPLARLMPLDTPKLPRQPGGWERKLRIADNFDDPLPPEIMAAFLGESDDPE